MKKTPEEIDALKQDWLRDPCWDIEHTEGFDEHRDELRAWREAQSRLAAERTKNYWDARAVRVLKETGISDEVLSQYVHTFIEIEQAVNGQNQGIGDGPTRFEMAKAELMQAQVRAILLLAAEVKRLADQSEKSYGPLTELVMSTGYRGDADE